MAKRNFWERQKNQTGQCPGQFKIKQGNRGDMRKIHVTRQFFEASGRHGDLIEKTKNPFLDKVNGSMCAKFQVCIVFRLALSR